MVRLKNRIGNEVYALSKPPRQPFGQKEVVVGSVKIVVGRGLSYRSYQVNSKQRILQQK